MSVIDELFRRLRAQGRKAFMPFVTAGDPDLEFSARLIRQLAAQGCDVCELGIPYSDPIADGPVIQASFTRALRREITLDKIFDTTSAMMSDAAMPLVAMVSYAIVYRHGLKAFVSEAKRAGFAGAIVPDLPVEEAAPLAGICRREDFSLILLVTPTTPQDRALRIAETSTGFLYYVSVTGITGERTTLPTQLIDNVSRLREKTDLPLCIGFGISQTEHVRHLAPVADGLIVGSAVVRRVAEAERLGRDKVLAEVGQYVTELITALRAAERDNAV